jgi:hypothetical protein
VCVRPLLREQFRESQRHSLSVLKYLLFQLAFHAWSLRYCSWQRLDFEPFGRLGCEGEPESHLAWKVTLVEHYVCVVALWS